MTYTVIFSNESEAALNALFDYIVDNSGRARAETHVGRLQASCAGLAHFPFRGVARDDLLPGVRTLSFEGRAAIDNKAVRILRVFSAGRDFERELSGH